MKLHRRRVSGLATLLERHYGATDWAYLNAWLKLLRYYDAEPLPELSAEQVKILCERQAAVWQALSDWMVGADRATQAYIAFREGLTRAAQVRIDTEQEVLAA